MQSILKTYSQHSWNYSAKATTLLCIFNTRIAYKYTAVPKTVFLKSIFKINIISSSGVNCAHLYVQVCRRLGSQPN